MSSVSLLPSGARLWSGLMLLFLAGWLSLPAPASAGESREIAVTSDSLDIRFAYPELGIPLIDEDAKKWAEQTVQSFVAESQGVETTIPYELKGEYTVVRPSDKMLTIVWNVWTFTGGAHGMQEVATFSYDAKTGQPLDLESLFADPQQALNVFSTYSYAKLSASLGDMLVEDMLKSGTSPDLDNFTSFAPVPGGIRLYFQPYQVAPWAAGMQEVEVPLEDLEDAGPKLSYWDK